ncbi:hypothetical protein M2322_002801 [Rhodoblastus acidophilus]|uniref:hypothetical protein n=1 Tax=Rhodoblastus acidophilus TaxID=1074 RepID=UPI002224D91B|nr:hypothetical protein [Rhodoblastus acidophilus]MCW2317242.1 hypothetical protein [Rhodoblastus acidophilus]
MANPNAPEPGATCERLVLVYSDGSMGVMPANAPTSSAMREAEEVDANETDPAHLTRIFRARVELLDEIPQERLDRAAKRAAQ